MASALVLALFLGIVPVLSHAADIGAAVPPTSSPAAPVRPVPLPSAFERAQEHYEAGHWAEAFEGYATLADCGHREAARIALQMRQFGPRLYGRAFMAGPQQLQRWRTIVTREGGGAACTSAPEQARKASQPASSSRSPATDPERELWRHQGVG